METCDRCGKALPAGSTKRRKFRNTACRVAGTEPPGTRPPRQPAQLGRQVVLEEVVLIVLVIEPGAGPSSSQGEVS